MKEILLIEDKVTLRTLLGEILKKSYNITLKENGLEALQWLQKGNIPDLILTDLKMPVMEGRDFIKTVKGSGIFKNIPIIVLSAKDSSGDKIECLKLGAADYLSKPFNPEELLVRMEIVLNK